MGDIYAQAMEFHRKLAGKIEVRGKTPIEDTQALSLAYSPGVAEPCRQIAANPDLLYDLTFKHNSVAVVSDGSAVLGLGNIGPLAAVPVMEGKALLFKQLAGIDAFPICLSTQDPEKIVEYVQGISPVFGGINLEDISAPRCFQVEEELRKALDIPVFHDDQHGTAVVVYAGLLNALKLVEKKAEDLKVVILGAGAAGTAIARLLVGAGISNVIVCDRRGALAPSVEALTPAQRSLAEITNPEGITGSLSTVIRGADLFIGVAAANTVSEEMIRSMVDKPLVFALANPEPEIPPSLAKKAGAYIIATGRSDCANQINNVLGFPGIFRGALNVRACSITENMKLAAALAIASFVSADELTPENIIPRPLDPRVVPRVAEAVAQAAVQDGVARLLN